MTTASADRLVASRVTGKGSRPVDPVTGALDKNSDGTISKSELAQASESLLELDVDESGTLEKEEMKPEGSAEGEEGEGRPPRPPHPPRR